MLIHLKQFLLDRQSELGRQIKPAEIVQATGLSRGTIDRLLKNRVKRIDENTVMKLCEFFDVAEGEPIPFLIYEVEHSDN